MRGDGETQSDMLGDGSIQCPHCRGFIEEDELQKIEPDVGFQDMNCPCCLKLIGVKLDVMVQYTAYSK